MVGFCHGGNMPASRDDDDDDGDTGDDGEGKSAGPGVLVEAPP